MKIGIIDADLCWRKRHRFPNLACMKLSGYHKSCGDETVLLLTPTAAEINRYDRVYLSKVFTDTPVPAELLRLPNVLTGGTGFLYDKAPPLLTEIEHAFPDYHLYDSWLDQVGRTSATAGYTDHSIGFLTRGCFRKCDFCVNKGYDRVQIHSPLAEFLDVTRPKITLLDDNFFGCPQWKRLLCELQDAGKPFRFIQGLDIRLMNDEKADMLFRSKYCGDFIFAFDNIADREIIEQKLQLARQHTDKRLKFYIFCGFDRTGRYDNSFWEQDIRDTFERIGILMNYTATPYITRFSRYAESPYRGMYITIARWCNQPSLFWKKSFRRFVTDQGEKHSAYRYATEYEKWFPYIAEYYDMNPIGGDRT